MQYSAKNIIIVQIYCGQWVNKSKSDSQKSDWIVQKLGLRSVENTSTPDPQKVGNLDQVEIQSAKAECASNTYLQNWIG